MTSSSVNPVFHRGNLSEAENKRAVCSIKTTKEYISTLVVFKGPSHFPLVLVLILWFMYSEKTPLVLDCSDFWTSYRKLNRVIMKRRRKTTAGQGS